MFYFFLGRGGDMEVWPMGGEGLCQNKKMLRLYISFYFVTISKVIIQLIKKC